MRKSSESNRLRIRLVLAGVIALSIRSTLNSSITSRRSLRVSSIIKEARYLHETDSTMPPWAHFNLKSVHQKPERDTETPIFWHIPKCGGTTAKRFYGDCLELTLANRLGASPKYGHDKDTEIVAFAPFPNSSQKLVNVDTTTEEGILRAKELGLVQSKKADMIFTSDINFAVQNLFDRSNKGRVFAFFRHPIDRLVSKFYYLQTATWENTYRPEWKDLTLLEWAKDHNADENHMVKKILGKKLNDPVDIGDLIVAKEIVRHKFIVGKMNDMEESIKRFNIVLGIKNSAVKTRQCLSEYFASEGEEETSPLEENELPDPRSSEKRRKASDNKNSHAHPKVEEGSPEWDLLAERNSLDLILYNYIQLLFTQQKNIIEGYRDWNTSVA
ncbi:hypothetical protein ACHAW6_008606 [Cyclotella cf. meneghiniana]